MSGRIVGEVLDNAPDDLTQLELLVLVCLAESATERDRVARHKCTREALANRARTTPATIKNVLKALRYRGLIVPLIEKPTKGVSQEYRISVTSPGTRKAILKGGSPSPPNGARKGDHPVPLKPVDNSTQAPALGGSRPPSLGGSGNPPLRNNLSSVDPDSVPTHLGRGVS